MSLNRYNAKTDTVQAAIIRGLEKAGVRVWQIKQPCDLLCLVQGRWQTLEIKTPEGKRGQVWRRRRMKTQNEFLDSTPTPIVTSLQDALSALGCVSLSTSARSTSKQPSAATDLVAGQ